MNKNLYKLFLIIIKYIPVTLSVCFIVNLIFRYFKLVTPALAYFGGTSFLFIAVLYLISFVFKFCHLYRIPLHYITISNFIGILYQYKIITLSIMNMYIIYLIIAGIAIVVYVWLMYKNRNNPKIDPIKQLCETYCDCNCE